jgi:hypothetical protein
VVEMSSNWAGEPLGSFTYGLEAMASPRSLRCQPKGHTFESFGEPNNPTTNSLPFWLTARRPDLLEMAILCEGASLLFGNQTGNPPQT